MEQLSIQIDHNHIEHTFSLVYSSVVIWPAGLLLLQIPLFKLRQGKLPVLKSYTCTVPH